jgi:hypothetical protein
MGFVQVRLEVGAINISSIAAFVRAGQTSLSISSYYLILLKSKQRLRAEGMLMPHLLQSPNVVSHSDKKLQFCNMDKKAKIKSGLFFGIAMTIFFILQSLLTHSNLTTKDIIISIISGLIGGALAGLLFGWLTGLFANSNRLTKDTKIDTDANETILFDTGANHFKGAEGVGGKLYLTNKRLVFKSHKFNIQNHELSISLSSIEKVDRYKTLGLVNNGLSIQTIDNKIEKFVVQKIDEWLNQLTEKNGLQQCIAKS